MRPLVVVASLLVAASPDPAPVGRDAGEAEALARFAAAALAEVPGAGMQDVYKWLFQAARGGEHAAPSEEAARSWLEREWASLAGPRPGEPLLVPLRPDGGIVRLNLRPFRAAGGDPGALLGAFLASARDFAPDPALFLSAWRAFGDLLPEAGGGAKGRTAFEELDRRSAAEGWPARHHTPAYAEANAPAYRVLTRAAAESLLRSLEEVP